MIDINASVSQLFLCNIRAQANQTFTGARNVRRPTLEASVVYQKCARLRLLHFRLFIHQLYQY